MRPTLLQRAGLVLLALLFAGPKTVCRAELSCAARVTPKDTSHCQSKEGKCAKSSSPTKRTPCCPTFLCDGGSPALFPAGISFTLPAVKSPDALSGDPGALPAPSLTAAREFFHHGRDHPRPGFSSSLHNHGPPHGLV
jgi:hypothetical protein